MNPRGPCRNNGFFNEADHIQCEVELSKPKFVHVVLGYLCRYLGVSTQYLAGDSRLVLSVLFLMKGQLLPYPILLLSISENCRIEISLCTYTASTSRDFTL